MDPGVPRVRRLAVRAMIWPMTHVVVVARVEKQAEEEVLQELPCSDGVSSGLRLAPGFDVSDLLAAALRDMLVASTAEQDARDVLLQSRSRGTDA
jgi:hypothetical protein